MGRIKSEIERLATQEQKSGWVDRKLGEALLVDDALEEHDRLFCEDLTKRREGGDRRLQPGEAQRLHSLHTLTVMPAIQHAVRHETNAERAERAKELQSKKGAARAPEANNDDALQS